MSEERIHELTQLRQQMAAIQARLADLSTPEEIEQMLQPKRQREAALVASLEGDGIVVQGDNNIALAQRAAHLRDNQGILTTGDGNIIIIADQVAADFWRQFRGQRPDLQQATSQYLAYLVRQYRYLAFKGMGVSDRVPLRLPLMEMYVPLKARIPNAGRGNVGPPIAPGWTCPQRRGRYGGRATGLASHNRWWNCCNTMPG